LSFTLRPAAPADAAVLSRLATDSFIAAFGHLYRPEDLRAFLEEYRSPVRYAADLDDPAKQVQIAEMDGRAVAYCLIVTGQPVEERPEPKPERPLFLSQLYCLPDATGHGIGAALMEWAITEARVKGSDAVQLSVFSENFGAQRFYQRYGFRHVADIHFWVGNHRDDEFLYELPF